MSWKLDSTDIVMKVKVYARVLERNFEDRTYFTEINASNLGT